MSFGPSPATTTPDPVSTATDGIKAAVRVAARGIVTQFGDGNVTVYPDGQGGAWVEIADLYLGTAYTQDTTFLMCQLHFNLPSADVYPMFIRPDLTRTDGKPLGDGFQNTQAKWTGEPSFRPVIQVSRRTRNSQFTAQSPAQKIEKVLVWIRT